MGRHVVALLLALSCAGCTFRHCYQGVVAAPSGVIEDGKYQADKVCEERF